MDRDAYNNEILPNNFSKNILDAKEARKAVMMFKDEYTLDFLNVEEIGERDAEDIDERVVEQNIVQNIKKFIMTFGHDFAFIGNQYHLEVYGVEHFPDLLFFNRELNSMVCVELKTGAFKTGYLGQLMTYLRILDDYVKKPHENPTIGIILCKEVNKEYVEYVIQDYDKPMGVATYNTSEEMPERLRNALPDIDELKKYYDENTICMNHLNRIVMRYKNLKTGEVSENGQVEIIDQDRLCYKIISRSKEAVGIRTISKDLLEEFYKLYQKSLI